MICIESGDVVEFFSEDIERLQHEVAKENGFKLLDHSLVLYVRPLKPSEKK
jgi:Fur family ferric uptake transcriptional regulator